MILKSGSFAACCAHGAIPVLAHKEPALAIESEFLPGPFYVTQDAVHLPEPVEAANARSQIYGWYQRHASAAKTAAVYARALS